MAAPVAYESAIDPAAEQAAMADAPPPGAAGADPITRLNDAQALREKGAISEAEFQTLKAQILGASPPAPPNPPPPPPT